MRVQEGPDTDAGNDLFWASGENTNTKTAPTEGEAKDQVQNSPETRYLR